MQPTTDFAPAPLRIVHVLRAPVGGLFRHVLDVTREQIARGHYVGLIADSLTGGARGEALLADLAPQLELGLLRLPIHRLPHPSDLTALRAVSRRLSELRPDIVHGHGSKGGALARLAPLPSFHPGPARVYTPHGGSLNYFPGTLLHRIFMSMENLLRWRTDLSLFESAYIADRYEKFVGQPLGLARVVRNGVAPKELEPVAPIADASDLLYVGEFRFAKGLDTLLDAMVLLAQEGRRPHLLLVGDGPEREWIREHAQQLGLAAQLDLHQPMAAREAFALGEALIVPSRAESLPYIVLEAAGAHKPIVASRVGGVPEIFGPFSDRLIPCDDAPALANAIRALLDEAPAVRAAKSAELADYVGGHFSLSNMVDGVIAGYRDALARRRAS
jgi:glycosyltransferase involved in cell wall biosynthesis